MKIKPPSRRDKQFSKWHRFSYDSQSVLVYAMIPRPAVLASIPILQILRKMPSFFLSKDIQTIDGNPLDQVAWDYARRQVSYRRFCQHVSKSFFSRPAEIRLRDCTAGAVRLALSFLRPFFHRAVQEDLDVGISYLHTFALIISQWPSQSWVNKHPEVRQVVHYMVLALGEELREKYHHQQQEEISHLQVIIDGLQYAMKTHDSQTILSNVEIDSDGDFEIQYEESDEPTLVTTVDAPSIRKRPSLELSIAVLPRMPISFQTPITPPDSPNHSFSMPTVVVPISNGTRTSMPRFMLHSHDGLSTLPEPSNEPSLSPTRSPVFSPPTAHHLTVSEVSISFDSDDEKNSQIYAAEQVFIAEQEPPLDQLTILALESQYSEDGNESVTGSPSIQWDPPAPSSTISSRRSSIVSIDTLCDTSEFPSKRFSIATSSSDVFDSVPDLPIEIASGSVTFSDPWSITPRLEVSIPPHRIDPSIIPLPPSPSSLASATDSMPSSLLSSPITPRLHLADLEPSNHSVISPKSGISLFRPLQMTSRETGEDEDNDRSARVVETASYIVTGFLVGAFITIFLFSTQRRTLLYLT